MSGITLAQAQTNLDALLSVQANPMASVSIGGRSYSYRSGADLLAQITYWQRLVAQLSRTAAGQSRHGYAVADLRRVGR